jgi:hypothetical protein
MTETKAVDVCYVSGISSLEYFLVPRTVNRESSKPENYGKGFSTKCMIHLSYLA